MRVVFFGTPVFAAHSLSYLLDKGVEVAAVVTRPDKPKGRSGKLISTPVKDVALKHQIPVFQPVKVSSPEFADVLPAFNADLFVVVAYGEIVKQHILDMPALGCINLHTSLLPKYRGAAPIQRAVMAGESLTGVTIMYMAKKMDAGDIILSQSMPIGIDETFGQVEERLCEMGSTMLYQVISEFESGPLKGIPQDEGLATFAPKVELEDCEINWHASNFQIHNLIRGAQPYPGAWSWVEIRGKKKRIKIQQSSLVDADEGQPGEILRVGQEGMQVGCASGVINIQQVQLEGKKPMTPVELLRGTDFHFTP
jgi:methionyl-tRNA formyltransferase